MAVADDVGDGSRVCALVVAGTGRWALVLARGQNRPNQSGWPTTTATTWRRNDPRAAALSVAEATALTFMDQLTDVPDDRSLGWPTSQPRMSGPP
jgi:hypothetical protein